MKNSGYKEIRKVWKDTKTMESVTKFCFLMHLRKNILYCEDVNKNAV